MSLRTLLRIALLLAAGAASPAVQAGACVLCVCTATTTSIVFPSTNPLVAANTDGVGNIRVRCGGVASISVAYTVALSEGTSGSMDARQMANGSQRLSYNVYTTNTRTTVWGDATGSTQTVSGSFGLDVLGSSPPQDLPVYGRIPGGQSGVGPGSYTDSLTITLSFF